MGTCRGVRFMGYRWSHRYAEEEMSVIHFKDGHVEEIIKFLETDNHHRVEFTSITGVRYALVFCYEYIGVWITKVHRFYNVDTRLDCTDLISHISMQDHELTKLPNGDLYYEKAFSE